MTIVAMDFKLFNTALPVFTRKPFRFAGEDFDRGEVFNWKKHKVPTRKMRQLIESGYIKPLSSFNRKNEMRGYDYRTLQLLCRSLKVKGNGSIGDLQERLWKCIKG